MASLPLPCNSCPTPVTVACQNSGSLRVLGSTFHSTVEEARESLAFVSLLPWAHDQCWKLLPNGPLDHWDPLCKWGSHILWRNTKTGFTDFTSNSSTQCFLCPHDSLKSTDFSQTQWKPVSVWHSSTGPLVPTLSSIYPMGSPWCYLLF